MTQGEPLTFAKFLHRVRHVAILAGTETDLDALEIDRILLTEDDALLGEMTVTITPIPERPGRYRLRVE